MDANQKLSSFSCEIRIVEAKNIELKSPKNLFVRYYLSAGNSKRIRLNTRRISSTSDFIWNECFSLECLGTQESIHSLKQATVVLELRQAKTGPVLGRVLGSQLVGRAEIPWGQVFESPNMEIERWVWLGSGNNNGYVQQPKLKVGMRVRVPEEMEVKKNRRLFRKWNNNDHECGCGCGCESHSHLAHYCADHHVFALAAAMEFL